MAKSPASTPVTNTCKGPVKAWSYSTHMNFVKCKRILYFDKVQRAKKPELVPPPGKEEHPLTRGNRVHEAAELYVRGSVELIPELHHFAVPLTALRDFFVDIEEEKSPLRMEMEEDWAFDQEWNPCGWFSDAAWIRMKVDCLLINSDSGEAIIIDYKTGRKHGNEVKHAIQAQLYQLATFLRYPELDTVTVEFWYTDHKEITSSTFKRSFGMAFKKLFTSFGKAITNEIEFRASPAPYSCKYCDWGRHNGSGICTNDYYLGAKVS